MVPLFTPNRALRWRDGADCAASLRLRMLARVARIGGGAVLAGGVSGGAIVSGALGEEGQRSAILMLMQLDDKLRPTLAATLPAEAFICLYSATRTPFAKAMGKSAGNQPASPPAVGAESVRVMGLSFRNDLGPLPATLNPKPHSTLAQLAPILAFMRSQAALCD